ncbi:hypothetical protein F3Y22_tig00111708pilonHSYRG00549 [Hibiscus syriacus]|uniref:Uncharacterized protein n=1 Tax=Hibiscus syriacus TaxID=106335 RepID=A0A6A2YIA4_HIBSY|nr:hypothetical protein F3Y22_tig00111708pilonHSYRG00549 [Hibiscus syriacus]
MPPLFSTSSVGYRMLAPTPCFPSLAPNNRRFDVSDEARQGDTGEFHGLDEVVAEIGPQDKPLDFLPEFSRVRVADLPARIASGDFNDAIPALLHKMRLAMPPLAGVGGVHQLRKRDNAITPRATSIMRSPGGKRVPIYLVIQREPKELAYKAVKLNGTSVENFKTLVQVISNKPALNYVKS